MAKQQIFERKAPEQDFLAKLEELLKKNRGSGTYEPIMLILVLLVF